MTAQTSSPQQLTLLPEVAAPLRFRLDDATRRRGLLHVAEIRAQLERQQQAAGLPDGRADRSAA
ncbi:MAG: hypothetical protein ACR2HQ_03555 [Ilumatobacteraceae bacterium]